MGIINLLEFQEFTRLLMEHEELRRLVHEIVLMYLEDEADENQ